MPDPVASFLHAQVSTNAVDAKGCTYWFPCHKWFGLGPEAGGMLERTLVASNEDPHKHMAEYKVREMQRGVGP